MITVGIPTFNRASHLGNAISSVLGQTFQDFELIICDDASTDGTSLVVESFDDSRIRYIRNPENLRIPGVLNRILQASAGDAIVLLHDHDIFHPELLDSMVEVLNEHPTVAVVNPGTAWVDPDGGGYEKMAPLPHVSAGFEFAAALLRDPSFCCPISACSLVRRLAYDAVGGRYDERYGFLSDVDMWFRIAMRFDIGQAAGTGLVCRRRGPTHEFGDGDWRLVRWLLSIYRDNAERYFGNDPVALAAARANFRRRATRLFGRNILAAAACGNLRSIDEGLSILGSELTGPAAAIARAVQGRAFAEKALVTSAHVAVAARRRLSARNWRSRRPSDSVRSGTAFPS